MTIQWYILPSTGSGSSRLDPRKPAYIDDGLRWGGMDYGLEPVFVCWADVTPAQHAAIIAHTDAIPFPDDLDAPLTASQVGVLQNALEAKNIPAGWVNVGMTGRQVLRVIAASFQFAQRWHGEGGGRLFGGGVNPDSLFGTLPQAARQRIIAVMVSLGMDPGGIVASTTLRMILKMVADQWGLKELLVGGLPL
jgi:hypothetical protein